MIVIIKNNILDWLFDIFSNGCDFCIRRFKKCYDNDTEFSKKLFKLKFWNKLGKWFNKMERLMYDMRYEEAL